MGEEVVPAGMLGGRLGTAATSAAACATARGGRCARARARRACCDGVCRHARCAHRGRCSHDACLLAGQMCSIKAAWAHCVAHVASVLVSRAVRAGGEAEERRARAACRGEVAFSVRVARPWCRAREWCVACVGVWREFYRRSILRILFRSIQNSRIPISPRTGAATALSHRRSPVPARASAAHPSIRLLYGIYSRVTSKH